MGSDFLNGILIGWVCSLVTAGVFMLFTSMLADSVYKKVSNEATTDDQQTKVEILEKIELIDEKACGMAENSDLPTTLDELRELINRLSGVV